MTKSERRIILAVTFAFVWGTAVGITFNRYVIQHYWPDNANEACLAN